MTFAISLIVQDSSSFRLGEYDESLHDVRSMIADLCIYLHGCGGSKFMVSGFGDDYWPLDIGTDLSIFLDELPEAIHQANSMGPFMLDFCEQGVERRVFFSESGTAYTATCESWTNWQPNPSSISVDALEVSEMLLAVFKEFDDFVRAAAPALWEHAWYKKWRSPAISARTDAH